MNFHHAMHKTSASLLATAALTLTSAHALAAPVQWLSVAGGNDNWYEYVSTGNIFAPISFDAARSAALARSHNGAQGYLATVTSAGEQAFINASFSFLSGFGGGGSTWLGASDAAVEGDWRWLDGPEAGNLVTYTNWLSGHPSPVENYDLLALYSFWGGAQGWVSVPSNGGAFGYLVEYGDAIPVTPTVPEPGSVTLVGLGLLGMAGLRRKFKANNSAVLALV